MRATLTILGLWLIAISTTFLVIRDTEKFTFLGPLYAICMIGSVVVVRRATGGR